ncbi:hypothetical protein BDZ89DRAFT_148863 [Hymenopellis radicata]|nr:hypothetical protein BDZ89DRAFT_148863 [Hymenopellis radicata]
MSEIARLSDITTEPECDLESFYFLENELELDGIEYHMGMSRGDISDYSSIATTKCTTLQIRFLGSSSALGCSPENSRPLRPQPETINTDIVVRMHLTLQKLTFLFLLGSSS